MQRIKAITERDTPRSEDFPDSASIFDTPSKPLHRSRSATLPQRPEGHAFAAEMDLTELDDRRRPTLAWSARGVTLSRSNLVIRSRRMSYPGRKIAVAIHLIDSEPVPMFGVVFSCSYEGDGLYLIDLDLQQLSRFPGVKLWARSRGRSAPW